MPNLVWSKSGHSLPEKDGLVQSGPSLVLTPCTSFEGTENTIGVRTCKRFFSIVNCSRVCSPSSRPALDCTWCRKEFSVGNCGNQFSSILGEDSNGECVMVVE